MLLYPLLLSLVSLEQNPEYKVLPKFLTNTETKLITTNPIRTPRQKFLPPTSPIQCVAEYEPMDGIMLAWEGFTDIVAQMAARITTIGNAKAYIVVDQPNEQSQAISLINSYEGDTNNVKFIYRTVDSVWIRDYGPRYIYEGSCRVIVDHTYNRPRPNDNALNQFVSEELGHAYFQIPLVHGGGNFHLNSNNLGWATNLIEDENPTLSINQIKDYWYQYQNLNVTITDAFPTSVDYTQHIDMWMCWASDTTCIISDWPNNPGSIQDEICDQLSNDLQSQGFNVIRIPATTRNGTHYTYTNSVICNDLVLVPSYSNNSVSPFNSDAFDGWRKACPDKTIIQIPCQQIVTSAGVMHCISMHVPKHLGGEDPTVHVRTQNSTNSYNPGESINIEWITDDDMNNIDSIQIDFSSNAGSTWEPITTNTEDDGSYTWEAPDIFTQEGLLRITAIDIDGNNGSDTNEQLFSINGTQIKCINDVSGDGLVNVIDLLLVVSELGSNNSIADVNSDQIVNVIDLLSIVGDLGQNCK